MTRPQLLLSATCGVLALGFLYEALAPLPAYSIPRVPATITPAMPTALASFIAPSPEAFAAITDRPLFDPARKKYVPPPTPEEQQAAAPPPPPTLALVGVILDGQTKLAIVRAPDAALASSMTVGAMIGGWQLSDIEPDRIVLKAGTAQTEIRLDANKAPPQTAPTKSLFPAQPASMQPGQQQTTP